MCLPSYCWLFSMSMLLLLLIKGLLSLGFPSPVNTHKDSVMRLQHYQVFNIHPRNQQNTAANIFSIHPIFQALLVSLSKKCCTAEYYFLSLMTHLHKIQTLQTILPQLVYIRSDAVHIKSCSINLAWIGIKYLHWNATLCPPFQPRWASTA